jgi:regulator of replication initiation timing
VLVLPRQLHGLQQQNARLIGHLAEVENHKAIAAGQISQMHEKVMAALADNERLKAELVELRKKGSQVERPNPSL